MSPTFGGLMFFGLVIIGIFFLYGGFKALFEARKNSYDRQSTGSNIVTALIMIAIGLLLTGGLFYGRFSRLIW